MSIISFLEENMLSCQWKEQFDMECTGCGMQRSIIHLLKGELIEAFYIYPAIYTLVKQGHKILLYLFITNLALMLLNFIIKNF